MTVPTLSFSLIAICCFLHFISYSSINELDSVIGYLSIPFPIWLALPSLLCYLNPIAIQIDNL